MTLHSTQALLTFVGADGFDVFNCSVPFSHDNRIFVYGTVEKRDEFHSAHTRLFRETAPDTFSVEPAVLSHQVENPHVAVIHGEVLMGGTQVIKDRSNVLNCYTDLYRGTPAKLAYFTSGPDSCLHLRAAAVQDDTLAIIGATQGEPATIRLATVRRLDDIDDAIMKNATPLTDSQHLFSGAQSVIVTQALLLSSGLIGCICLVVSGAQNRIVACAVDRTSHTIVQGSTVADRSSFPSCSPKAPLTAGKLFPAGIVEDVAGTCHLYSGVDDSHQCRITIPYPFEQFGTVVGQPTFPAH